MKKIFLILFLTLFSRLLCADTTFTYPLIKVQVKFAPNNISTWIWNSGIFNQNLQTNNTPGFEWPKGSGKYALFTSGLCIGAYYNNGLRMANATFNGEYAPGYVWDSLGYKLFKTNSKFRLYSVKYNDTYSGSVDYAEWKYMVPYGAPYKDVNNNGYFDELIDKPGVEDAMQTVFVYLTDANPDNHTTSEGFSGGTKPLYAEVALTLWGYDFGPLADIQYIKWKIINKSDTAWKKTYFSVVTDHDIGDATDDYSGCDTNLQLAYGYNADNNDGNGQGRTYGVNPPAAGQTLLRGALIKNYQSIDSLKLTSSIYFTNTGSPGPVCEQDPSSNPTDSYNYMKGNKRNNASWYIPFSNPLTAAKFCYSGDPETNTGWTCRMGRIESCGVSSSDSVQTPVPPNNGRFILSSGSDGLTINPGDTQKIVIAQMIVRGSNNFNAVTKLKELADFSRRFYYGYVSEEENLLLQPEVYFPNSYKLHQNFPNPFNPVTTIKYEMKKLWKVKIEVYDARGEIVTTLVNEEKPQGVYEVQFNGSNLPSGIYFIKMMSGGGFEDSKKIVLLK